MDLPQLRMALESMANPRIGSFAASLIPHGAGRILGVRIPLLRTLAKQLAHEGWHEWFQTLHQQAVSMEELLIQGMLPGYAPHAPLQERLLALDTYVPRITNWSLCDTCCSTCSFVRQHRKEVWSFLQPYLHSEDEFPARFGTVMLLNHYTKAPDWAPFVAEQLPRIPATGFYAEMAIGWCLCELYIHAPNLAQPLLEEGRSPLRPNVLAIAQRKIRESRRCP